MPVETDDPKCGVLTIINLDDPGLVRPMTWLGPGKVVSSEWKAKNSETQLEKTYV